MLGLAAPGASLYGAEPVQANHALLVGCSAYPHLDAPPLAGAANDVVLMKRLLTESFGFPTANVTVLAESDPAARPTRANIERQFARLAALAGPDSQIVILMSGHGTQVPASDPTAVDDFEPDGLDEVFLCADARPFDVEQKTLPGGIVDSELGSWVRRIRDRGAHVWIIVDCCHSGTILRGPAGETLRRVPIEKVVPRDLIAAVARRAPGGGSRTRGGGPSRDDVPLAGDLENIAALYAAQPEQSTIELPLPPEADSPTTYGLLTYTLNEVLTQSAGPLTHRELAQRIAASYQREGRTSPTPFLEGGNRDREVLGLRQWPGRSVIRIVADPPRINAGSLHGLAKGTILKILGRGDPPDGGFVGYAKVVQLGSLDAQVEGIAYAGQPAPAQLPLDARCEIERMDYGVSKLKIATELAANPRRNEVAEALLSLAATSKLLQLTDVAAADWVVRSDEGQLFVEPATGFDALDPALTPRFGPLPDTEQLSGWLGEHLSRVARGRNLLAMARPAAASRATSDKPVCQVRFELVRLRDPDDNEGTPIVWDEHGRTLQPGELIGCRLENLGEDPVDVTLFFVDSGYGITALFPRPGVQTDNRLYPGDKPFVAFRARVQADTVGLEHLVMIAVPGSGDPVDFCVLEQPTLPRTRGGSDRALDSPLGELLQRALYGQQTRGGAAGAAVSREQLDCISWRVAAP